MTDVPSHPTPADSPSPEHGNATPGEAGQHAFDAFLSYSWADKPIARALHKRLVDAGLRVWIDDQQIPIGANLTAAIEKGLESSRHLIVLVSRASLDSGWATVERHVALFSDPDARHGVILPVLLEDIAPLPPALRIRRWVRLHGEAGLDALVPELLAAIRGAASAPAPAAAPKPAPKAAPASPQPAPEPRSKRALLWTARALAAASALAPLVHHSHPDPIIRQCASLVAPAVLAATIGIELTFHHYRLAVAELAALALVLLYAARMPEPPPPPKPAPELPSTPAPSAGPGGGDLAADAGPDAAALDSGAPGQPLTPGTTPPRPKGTSALASAADAGVTVDPMKFATSGWATCHGQRCTLDIGNRRLPQGTTRACLSPASPQPELAGLRATCRIDGSGPGCIRDDRVATVTLKTPITWSLCTP
ncbi:toll/interleukin-1 receptor domain-containing protein [Sorangium sp. So ce1014]|uniref:toll/interleukin-1 receptor domain-containing protein n=1 Tax=Sorangium sp. So ce1014 TaxID=3133326 RepID=UPI003F5FC0CD